MKKYKHILLPLLLTLGPFWMVSFIGNEWTLLRLAGIAGALGLSLGLIQLLSRVYYLQQRIEWLESLHPDYLPSELPSDQRKNPFKGNS